MRHSLYFRNVENPKVRFPLAVPEKRIIVRAQVLRRARAGNNTVEQATDGRTIKCAAVNGESNDAPGELVHDQHDPVRAQD